MIIDAHVHVTGSTHPGDKQSDATDLIKAMDAAGVDVSVAQSRFPADNAAVLAAGRSYPERVLCFIEPENGPEAEAQVAEAVAAGAIHGLGEFYIRPGSTQLPEVYLKPVLAAAREHHLPVLLHTGDFSYTAPIMVARMVSQYPDVTFILGHMGSLTFVLDAIEVCKLNGNVFLETSGMTSPGMLRRAVAECGPERILFGSDCPYWHPEVERARIEAARLGPRTTQLVLGENVGRLLDL
jgi:predicted TIM-barrel fold metal-dependent hydrolase